MSDAKTLIKNARRREATYRFCVRGDLAAEYDALEAQLAEATPPGWTATSLADANPLADLAERIKAIRAEMTDNMVALRLRALRRHDWEELLAAHRKDDGDDLDVAGFSAPLVRACLVDPEFTSSEFDDLWDDVLNDAQRDELFGVAFAVNTEATTVPFSERASVVTRWRDERSRQPEPGESPAASS